MAKMGDASRTLKPWVTFAGCILIVVILYWAQAVLVPMGKGGSVEKLQETLDDIQTDLEKTAVPRGAISRPRVVVTSEQVAGWAGLAWLGPMVGWLSRVRSWPTIARRRG